MRKPFFLLIFALLSLSASAQSIQITESSVSSHFTVEGNFTQKIIKY